MQLIRCFSWLEYLSRGLNQGTAALEGALALQWTQERHLELLHEDLVAMVELHGAMHRTHVALLRRATRRALELFPSNVRLLSAFVRNEQRAGLDARMRRLLDDVCAQKAYVGLERAPEPWEASVLCLLLTCVATDARRCFLGSSPSLWRPIAPAPPTES